MLKSHYEKIRVLGLEAPLRTPRGCTYPHLRTTDLIYQVPNIVVDCTNFVSYSFRLQLGVTLAQARAISCRPWMTCTRS